MTNSISIIAARFGCTPKQAAAQFAANAKQLRDMRYQAVKSNRKVNGYSAEDLELIAATMEARARGEL